MNLLGRCCEEGWGRPRDAIAAADWYRRSAEGGYFRGQYNWGSILLRCGRCDEAALWLARASTSGTAAVRLAVLSLISRIEAPAALQDLAARLKGSALS
jgi:TPR repeat protein